MVAKFLQKVRETVTLDKKARVYHYAEPLYPEIVNYLIENSITAKTSINLLSNFIIGNGFGVNNDISISNDLSLLDFGRKLSDSIARNRGAYIHVVYDPLTKKSIAWDVLPFHHGRIGVKDDTGWNGKFGFSKDWTNSKDVVKFDTYNPRVLDEKIKRYGKDFKGFIYYINLDYNEYYPYSTIHPVIHDCKSEINASVFKSTSLESGFFGKTIVVTRPFTSSGYDNEDANSYKAQNEREAFRNEMRGFVGAENANGILHVEMNFDSMDDIEKQIVFKNIQSDINDRLFEYTENSVKKNIMATCDNIPPILVLQNEGMFGNSGEAIIQATQLYNKNTAFKREVVERAINELWIGHENYNGEKLILETL